MVEQKWYVAAPGGVGGWMAGCVSWCMTIVCDMPIQTNYKYMMRLVANNTQIPKTNKQVQADASRETNMNIGKQHSLWMYIDIGLDAGM